MDWSKLLFNYLAALNIICFVVFAYDKFLAKVHWRRIPEATLLTLAALGGAAGGWLAMGLVRHKTRKLKFRLGVPALLVVQLLALGLVYYLLHR